MKKKYLLISGLLFCFLLSGGAETDDFSLDDLFADSQDEIQTSEVNQQSVLSQLESVEPIVFSPGFSFSGFTGMGWKDFPVAAEDFKQLRPLFGLDASAHVGITARPDKNVKMYTYISTSIDQNTITKPWSIVKIEQLYIDYNLKDFSFIKIGKFPVSVGKFLDLKEGTSFLLNFPLLLDGVNLFANVPPTAIVPDDPQQIYKNMLYSVWLDKVFGTVRFTTGLQYVYKQDLTALLALKTVLFDVDTGLEALYKNPANSLSARLNFLYPSNKFQIGGEYSFTLSDNFTAYTHAAEGVLRLKSIFDSGVDLYFAAKHAFNTSSGYFLGLLSFSPWHRMTTRIGIPVIYGNQGFAMTSDLLDGISLNKRLSLILSVTIAADL
ncbi:hypothetical protein [Treponema brennaborense]|uniref:Uncharacterized protein n=1 Tax=Treponema brennaborense (strain DSM 12168 / CIP 105900 / DD5/3) TaxID=906968 RepID=F4LJG8_TREBD|nr:hypothetical protein [Treponema brennaborense]AEE16363.1 hypothetical protein Trebr_0927 [Treponema brennaborense DSM 12168]